MPQFSMGQPTHQVSHCIGVLYYESSDVIVEAKLVEDEHDLQHHLVVLLLGLQEVDEAVQESGLADEVGRGRVSDASSQKDDNF